MLMISMVLLRINKNKNITCRNESNDPERSC